MDGNAMNGAEIPDIIAFKIRPLMDGNTILVFFCGFNSKFKIRPLMDGNH